jgi:hypothetical protein
MADNFDPKFDLGEKRLLFRGFFFEEQEGGSSKFSFDIKRFLFPGSNALRTRPGAARFTVILPLVALALRLRIRQAQVTAFQTRQTRARNIRHLTARNR